MSLTTPYLYPTAQAARSLASLKHGGDESVQNTIDTAINAAIDLGLFTCTASVSGIGQQNIQNNMNCLQSLGYTVSLSGTTLTISW